MDGKKKKRMFTRKVLKMGFRCSQKKTLKYISRDRGDKQRYAENWCRKEAD